MGRVTTSLVLLLGLVACSPSYESACKDLCDKAVECSSPAPTAQEIRDCDSDCVDLDNEAQANLNKGSVEQDCYDAAVDLLSCAAGLSCAELRQSEVPPECRDEVDAAERECN